MSCQRDAPMSLIESAALMPAGGPASRKSNYFRGKTVWRNTMNRRTTFMLISVAHFACAMGAFPEFGFAPAFGQAVAPAVEPASATQRTASVPDLSGIWSRPYFGVEPP